MSTASKAVEREPESFAHVPCALEHTGGKCASPGVTDRTYHKRLRRPGNLAEVEPRAPMSSWSEDNPSTSQDIGFYSCDNVAREIFKRASDPRPPRREEGAVDDALASLDALRAPKRPVVHDHHGADAMYPLACQIDDDLRRLELDFP